MGAETRCDPGGGIWRVSLMEGEGRAEGAQPGHVAGGRRQREEGGVRAALAARATGRKDGRSAEMESERIGENEVWSPKRLVAFWGNL